MNLSEKYQVPPELALLYDFLNSLDLRRYMEKGIAHAASDELAAPHDLTEWLRVRALLDDGGMPDDRDHRDALALRQALRSFLALNPLGRAGEAEALNAIAARFPFSVTITKAGTIDLKTVPGAGAIGRVLAELHLLSQTGRLDRLRMCASKECQWIFFDRSKPGNRRWCSSERCGNRQKTRAYRQRQRGPRDMSPPR